MGECGTAVPGAPVGTGVVDGVRTLVLSGPRPGVDRLDVPGEPGPELLGAGGAPGGQVSAARARLLFRVGLVDETAADLGITLLALRLATAGLASAVEAHVWVGPTTSGVELRGGRSQVARAITAVTRRIAAEPDPGELAEVRTRLRSEEDAGLLDGVLLPPGVGAALLGPRFVVLGMRLLALPSLTAAEVVTWSAERLVADAAVLLTEGVERGSLVLDLPRGLPVAEPAPGPPGPGRVSLAGDVPVIAMRVPRSWPARVAGTVFSAGAAARLAGDAVDVRSGFQPLTRTEALLWVRAVPVRGREQECVDGLAGELAALARDVPPDLLGSVLSRWAGHDGMSAEATADEVAEELLLGGELGDSGSPLRALDVSGEQVRAVLSGGAPVLAGPARPRGNGWRRPRVLVPDPGQGRVWVSADSPGVRVVVGQAGLVVDGVHSRGTGAGWDEVAVVLVGDGGRDAVLVLRDGRAIAVRSADWRGPRRRDLVAEVVEQAGRWTRVRFDALADPVARSSGADRRGVPAGSGELRSALRRRRRLWLLGAVSLFVLAVVSVPGALDGRPEAALLGVGFLVGGGLSLRAARDLRRRAGPPGGRPVRRARTAVGADRFLSSASFPVLVGWAVLLWVFPPALVVWWLTVSGEVAWPALLGWAWAVRVSLELYRHRPAGRRPRRGRHGGGHRGAADAGTGDGGPGHGRAADGGAGRIGG